ncbi:AAA family ATPase [Rhodococcus sp. BP-349]|uniref:AAA domain-containing protein n=1 Tax=unclassified Rhodococcus (in: high G+C Gram-positive bacteria) TaxID=192944 RepID=UPI001C9A70B2|nr:MULTISPECIES: AAA domain-containing protein [unclassified Rhodococcus (in: high G+C Gram-positive bacteria)]MBY6540047.1 AAA family ATPase [Rhodococcus sp. BP-363]MBY6543625.1 AAA family ATPase [Rhodococcus sp. BP-369]MBY6562855.1 AAA family ATPase [Rhodococcus sp. BP-370]MBY6577147.1 AAA family ATPase [Rhodococcus sp. BP-364]MBY6586448.1 AAA family ATPase [Rhodococcus sp. BP-358]
MVDSGDAEVRARVRRLLGFLRETVAARSKPVRAYGPDTRLEWLYRPGRALEIDTNAAPGQTAVRVPRVSVETAPAPSPTWSAWVNGTLEDARKRPVVDPAIPREHREAAHEWLAEWSRWAEEDSRIRPFAALYLSVDRMREDILEQPETVEVVLASGLLAVDVGGSAIDTHLVTQPVKIMREDETGDLLVRATLGSSARLEDKQIFAGLHGLDISQSDRLLSKLTETASTPLSPEVSDVLSEWAARAVGGLRYVSASDMPPAIRRGTVREAPALLLRPRSGFALISYFDAMIAAMDTGAPVPLGLQQLVESIDSTDRLDWLSRKPDEAPAEVLFPLAVNRAQGSIMEKLALDTGVVVEGPPGTGKTHTIANLMSAMLAQGKRVLVTSEKAQALRVLRDKLPAELQDLCVSVTDLAKGGSAELDHSVSVIADRLEKFELGDADRRISDLTRLRHGAYQRRHVIKQSAVSARRAEAEHHHFGHRYTGTLVGILQKLEGTEHLSWVPGPVYSEAPPITETEFLSLATLLVSSEVHEVDRRQHTLPRLGDVLPPAAAIRRLLEQSSQASVPAHLADVRPTDARQHAAVARRILGKATALDGDSQRMLQKTLSGRLSAGWDKASELPQLVERARDLDRRLGSAAISVGDASRRVFEAYDLAAQALAGGRGLRRLRTPRELTAVAELGVEVTVDGNVPRTATDYRAVADHLQFALLLDDARSTLFELGIELPPAHDRRQRLEQMQGVWDRLIDVRAVTSAIASLESALDGRIRLLSIDDVQSLIHDLAAVVTSAENEHVAERLIAHASDFEAATGGADSPEALQVSDALRLADRAAFDDAVVAYEHALGEHHEQSALDALLSRLDLEAPSLSTQLVEDRTTDWPALAATFNDAWAWRWARQQVEQRLTRPTAPNLDDDFDAADGDLSALTATLAAESAWRACLQRMTTREMQALRTYQDSVGHIGDGRNRRSQRYRAAARTAMHEAQSAVPAWIMPIGEVLSTIPPVQDSFDVVIVDEASQAEPSSLFLMWLAPRVIVVGDDRQCAPNLIPQESEERVLARLDTYLPDLLMHVRNNFGPGSSLFSLLRSRYPQRVRLREHFRCMPEIIEWSSTQFYRDTPLVPVRQFGADRLKPLRSTFVAGAATRGSGTTLVNEAEAESLVEALCTCVADTDYEGRTFGVMVLQSQAHAEFIRARLAEKIPAEQRDELRLRVGTPSDFQGDERDVVFVSMVVAPTSVTNALTSARWQRSFNVAASRARDQMWLFHSVRVEELSPADLRASLLTYVHALPAVPVPQMPDVSDAHTPHSSFASMTAQRLFMILRDRGYHVNPSVEINDLELDLVVTGVDTRLAVECDDDRDQSVDAVAVRFDREADLRRAGWNFVRLRASDLFADPGTAVAPVIEALDALGILPGEVTIDQERKTGDWHPVTLTAADEDDDGPEEKLLVALAPSVLTDVAPLPPPVVADTRSSRMPATELEPGETRPPRFDGSTVIRVDSRYGSSRRSSATPSVQPRPAAPRPSSTVIPKRVDTPAAAPAVPVTSATGIETLSPEIQARLAALPAASMATGRVIAVAAARPGAPLTVRRCALVTGLTPVVATQLLGELQRSGKLVRRQRRDGVAEWVRPEDAA